jgi:hypothetical protein
MIVAFIPLAILLGITLFLSILRSVNVLRTRVGTYYDFPLGFQYTRRWTVAIYVVIVAILTIAVFLAPEVRTRFFPA